MRIEFLGLPGAGKTTIRSALSNEMIKRGITQCMLAEHAFFIRSKNSGDKLQRYTLNCLPKRFALKLSSYFQGRSLFQYQCQNQFLSLYAKSLSTFLSSDSYHHMAEQDRANVIGNYLSMGALWQMLNHEDLKEKAILFEEGFIQKSFMFIDHHYVSHDMTENIKNYLANVPLPNILIYVKTDLITSYQRMLKRPDGLTQRLKGLDNNKIEQFLDYTNQHIHILLEELENHSLCEVIEVTNNQDIDSLVNSLASTLEACLLRQQKANN